MRMEYYAYIEYAYGEVRLRNALIWLNIRFIEKHVYALSKMGFVATNVVSNLLLFSCLVQYFLKRIV